MSTAMLVAFVLVLAAAFGSWSAWRAPRRRGLRIGLQWLAAALLYLCLFPPLAQEPFAADELVVLTPAATPAQIAAASAANRVALPGVDTAAIERVPDLGTALRRHPEARRLHIVGGGLPSRDRDAARGLVAAFDAAPLPRGLVELNVPGAVRAGSLWRASGRVENLPSGRVELRDPSGAVVATQALDAQGRFDLTASAKAEGMAAFALNVFDRDGVRVDQATLPLAAQAGAALKILLLAGAPDAELKYLRRWAADAGVALDSRIALSDGVALHEGALEFDADTLRGADLAILDERSWAALDTQRKDLLRNAVREGLGLLLRVTGPLPAPVAADWAELGYRVEAAQAAPPAALDRALGLSDSGYSFARRAITVDATQAAPLLRADDGAVFAWVGNSGRGRIALWLLADSYRLNLGGAAAAFGTLWSESLAAVARARGEAAPQLPTDARVDQRAVLCGLADAAAVEDETGARTALFADAARCAAYWPAQPGWHVLVSGGARWPFYVRAAGESTALAAGATERATRALLGASSVTAASASREVPWPRWPFFLAWLAAVAALWWLERGSAVQ